MEDKIFVVGHKNPDTDSICSAISYSYFKNQLTRSNRYVPKRAGQINEESEFVLKYFGVDAPEYMPNVGTQVKDLLIDESEGGEDNITIRIAWEYMKESGVSTLPIMDADGALEGIITVTDIANYYMDSYTKTIMSEAKTKYYDIAETINGTVMVGNEHAYFTKGKVLVGASQPEHLAQYMDRDDLVIVSDRTEMQLTAIENGASCVVVTLREDIVPEVRALAEERCCVVICTRFDTFTVARLINQAVPVKSLMRKKDNIVSFHLEDFVDDIREVMGKKRYRSFPILNHSGQYVGMISRASLLTPRRKRLILVDHTEKSQAVDNLDQAEILEIIDHHRVGTLETVGPVFFRGEPVGCSNTIIYKMFRENNIPIPPHIAGLMASAICSDTLLYRSPTCTSQDIEAGNALAKIAGINLEEYARKMFRAASNLGSKTPEEILHQDFKKFIFGETVLGVGQISSMDAEELLEIEARLRPQLEKECGKNGMQMVFFMLTNIIEESTCLLCYGKGCEKLIEESYKKTVEDGKALLPGVVSRKKQLIPAFMDA
ncbi:MAG: putative manganese-dependent inorganic diphosphatase, partial [Lachnospiraceae bacterium]